MTTTKQNKPRPNPRSIRADVLIVAYRTDPDDPSTEQYLPFSELALIADLTPQTLRKKWRNHGRPEPLHKDHPVMTKVAGKYKNMTFNNRHATPKGIAEELDIPEQAVWVRLKRHGPTLLTKHFDDYFEYRDNKRSKEEERRLLKHTSDNPLPAMTTDGKRIHYVTPAERKKLDSIPGPSRYELENLL